MLVREGPRKGPFEKGEQSALELVPDHCTSEQRGPAQLPVTLGSSPGPVSWTFCLKLSGWDLLPTSCG